MGHEPTLIPDYTLFIQLGIFMASYLVMRALVFKPFVELLQAREAKTTGLAERAVEAENEAAKFRADYDVKINQEKQRVAAYVDGEKAKIADEERKILEEARHSASQQLEAVRNKVRDESDAARTELHSKVGEFASQMTSRILGYSVNIQGAKKAKHSEPEDALRG
ncbi:MAG: ATP synthase F0 subunit B [Bdellovibrionaceae bacterium]|nr:ATP synthase F0 subunit B [Bdellovibrionales bacterium]MCB9253391.1 ATP synthase F0 subunit B [Pseudobdellovibrionaceae bacterium]